MEINLVTLIKPILLLLSIIIGLYILASTPKSAKGLDYKKIIASVKANPFKWITVIVVLYAAYVSLLYNNSKSGRSEDREEYYATLDRVRDCRRENERLTEKVDSLTQVVNAMNAKR